jgi:hypothetical protein
MYMSFSHLNIVREEQKLVYRNVETPAKQIILNSVNGLLWCGAVAQLGPRLPSFEVSRSHKTRHTHSHTRTPISTPLNQ